MKFKTHSTKQAVSPKVVGYFKTNNFGRTWYMKSNTLMIKPEVSPKVNLLYSTGN